MTESDQLAHARAALFAGRGSEAIALCQAILAEAPGHREATHLAGLAALVLGDTLAASRLLNEATALAPHDAHVRVSLARALRATGEDHRAADVLRETVQMAPHMGDAWVLLGLVLNRLGDARGAEGAFRRAATVTPESFEAWLNLGNASLRDARLADALECYAKAKALRPERAESYAGLGLAYHRLLAFKESIPWLEQAVGIDGGLASCRLALGEAYWRVGDFEKAESTLLDCMETREESVEARLVLALIHLERGAFRRAAELLAPALTARNPAADIVAASAAALELAGDETGARALRPLALAVFGSPARLDLAMGRLLARIGRNDAAIAKLERSIEADAESSEAKVALGNVALASGRCDTAAAAFRAASTDPTVRAEAEYGSAMAALFKGDYAAGWDGYERRWEVDPALRGMRSTWPGERWNGGACLEGKHLLLVGEQGVGDEIMFASIVPEIGTEAGHCTLAVARKLVPLFRRSFPRVRVVDREQPAWLAAAGQPEFHVPLGSLPSVRRRREADFPDHGGYLLPDPEARARWRALLDLDYSRLKVGVAWRGGTIATGAARRSLAPGDLEVLLAEPGVRFVNVQYGSDRAEASRFGGARSAIGHWQEAIDSVDESASLIAALDLVITVCSAVAHLAGALGRPVWVLTPSVPEWRYRLAGDRMPWYPSARLFRQVQPGQWEPVVAQVAAAVRACRGAADLAQR